MVGRDAAIVVYIMTDKPYGTLYVGVTSRFMTRMVQHREGVHEGFTKTYGLKRLVWFEYHESMIAAIQREVDQALASRLEDQPDRTRQSPLGRPLPTDRRLDACSQAVLSHIHDVILDLVPRIPPSAGSNGSSVCEAEEGILGTRPRMTGGVDPLKASLHGAGHQLAEAKRPMRMAAVIVASTLATVAAPALAQTTAAPDYASGANWLCRPGRADACAVDLSATVVSASGSLRREEFRAAREPRVDCFYVYPTVSRDPGPLSDLEPQVEERRIVASQFARFASVCRTFAPLYRQVTATAFADSFDGGPSHPPFREGGYADVLAAWRHYLAGDNQGRGVVLIGAGQGGDLLSRLIAEEIDGQPDQRRLVSAILTGTTVRVAAGRDVGGTFRSIPLCRRPTQTGCVVTYSSYRAADPASRRGWFGRNAEDSVAACTNPANLKTGGGVANSYFSAIVRGRDFIADSPMWAGPEKPVGTPFVKLPGLISTACVSDGTGTRLLVQLNIRPDVRTDDINGDLLIRRQARPEAGLSQIDLELHLGDLVNLVGRQARAYRPAR